MTSPFKESAISRELLHLSAGFFFLFFGASHQQFFVAYLRDTLGWGETLAQAVLGTVYATFMVWRLLVGYTLRPLGDYLSIVLGGLTYPIFVAVIWGVSYATGSFPIIGALAASALWGWGAASMWLTSGAQVLDAAKKSRYGMASGVFHASSNIGFALGVFAFDAILRAGNASLEAHRTRLLITMIAMGVGCACLSALPRKAVERRVDLRTALRFMAHPRLRIASFLMASSSIGFGVMLSVFPNFVRETLTHPLLSTAAFFPLARALLSLTGSPASDRWGRGPILFGSFLTGSIGLGVAAAFPRAWTAGLAAFLLGLLGGLVPPVASALVGDITKPEERPLALGAVFFWRDFGVVFVFAVSITRALVNVLISERIAFAFFAALFGLSAVVSVLLIRLDARRDTTESP